MIDEIYIDNAIVKYCDVIVGDHGKLHVSFQFQGDGFGGSLPLMIFGKDEVLMGAYLKALLETFEVSSLRELTGIPIRFKRSRGSVVAVGHFMRDSWFVPQVIVNEMKEKKTSE